MKTLFAVVMWVTVAIAGLLALVFFGQTFPDPELARFAHGLGIISVGYVIGFLLILFVLRIYLWIYGLFVRYTADQWYQGRDDHYDR